MTVWSSLWTIIQTVWRLGFESPASPPERGPDPGPQGPGNDGDCRQVGGGNKSRENQNSKSRDMILLFKSKKSYFFVYNFKNLVVPHTYILAILFIFFNNCSFNSFNFLTRVNPSHYLFNVPNFQCFFFPCSTEGGGGGMAVMQLDSTYFF